MALFVLFLSCLVCSTDSAGLHTPLRREVLVRADALVQKAAHVKKVHSIPKQLICTGKPENFDELTDAEKKNIGNTLALNPGFEMKYLGDKACRKYLQKHFKDSPLVGYYETEPMGMYRGDMCRTAVLAHEGGYYTDLDVALELPFSEIVTSGVSFASVLCNANHEGEVLNAVMIAAPGHPIMKQTLEKMVDWYREGSRKEYLGTLATKYSLDDFQSKACPKETISSFLHVTTCGEGKVRMLEEKLCSGTSAGCPAERLHSEWTKFGLYGEDGKRFGWSRFAECQDLSCGGTGRAASLLEVDALHYVSSHRSQLMHSAPAK